jgi:hypothetical protein
LASTFAPKILRGLPLATTTSTLKSTTPLHPSLPLSSTTLHRIIVAFIPRHVQCVLCDSTVCLLCRRCLIGLTVGSTVCPLLPPLGQQRHHRLSSDRLKTCDRRCQLSVVQSSHLVSESIKRTRYCCRTRGRLILLWTREASRATSRPQRGRDMRTPKRPQHLGVSKLSYTLLLSLY